MKLLDIKPISEANKPITQLELELDQARSKYSAWRRDNSIKSNKEIPHHLQNKMIQFVDKIQAANEQLKTAKENEQSDEQKKDSVKFNQKLATRNDDKEAKAKRLGKASGEGLKAAKAWVDKQGGYKGAAKALIKIAKEQTNDGQEPFDAQAVADKIGITKGSVLRWINTRSEFNGMKRFTQR